MLIGWPTYFFSWPLTIWSVCGACRAGGSVAGGACGFGLAGGGAGLVVDGAGLAVDGAGLVVDGAGLVGGGACCGGCGDAPPVVLSAAIASVPAGMSVGASGAPLAIACSSVIV